ncbi:MAG: hypothetical protein B7Y99_09450 [Caulobacterales bacterium 32-69-10]|nr:MAG: hypothetical protein B7Y99_09450 [Caulobacterales bacterium 32-69-10]
MRILGVAMLLAAVGSASAQEAPVTLAAPTASVDLGSPVVEALEVVAQPPGPALWKVTKGDSCWSSPSSA